MNIVYGRPNRSFLHGKGLAFLLMVGSLVTLFVALLAGSLGVSAFCRNTHPASSRTPRLCALDRRLLLGVFVFLISCYYVLTNEEPDAAGSHTGCDLRRDPPRGNLSGASALSALRGSEPGAACFGAPAILLVWLYVMANVIVFGAELNWWRARRAAAGRRRLAGLA